jgi:hypothetical protein
VYVFRRLDPSPALRRVAAGIVALVVAQIAAGVGLAYLPLPPVLQVTHVTLGSLLLGVLLVQALLAYRLPVAPAGRDLTHKVRPDLTPHGASDTGCPSPCMERGTQSRGYTGG